MDDKQNIGQKPKTEAEDGNAEDERVLVNEKDPEVKAQDTPAQEKAKDPEGETQTQAGAAGDVSNGTAAEASNASGATDASLKEEIAKLQEDLKVAQATTINTAKRMTAESQKKYQQGIEHALFKMLDIIDGLESARDYKTDDGVSIALSQFAMLLSDNDCETIAPLAGDRLDPQIHQAIVTEVSDKFGENRILRLDRKGYRRNQPDNDRVIRPATVVVSSPKKPDNKDDGQTSNGEEK